MIEQIKKYEVNFFDKFSGGSYDVFTNHAYVKLLNIFSSLVQSSRDRVILDLGCGSGAFSRYLAESKIPLLGIDLCLNLVVAARKKINYAKFVVGDMEALPVSDESVDLVVFSGALHHLPNIEIAVKEAYRVLKKGGRCFAYDPNKRNPIMWLYRDKHSPFYSNKGVTANERLLTTEELSNVFLKSGFNVKVSAISGLSYRYIEDRKKAVFLSIFNCIDSLWGSMPFSKKYGSFLITLAQK